MGRIHEHIHKLILEQMRYSKGSKEYTDIQIEINKLKRSLKMASGRFNVSYVEEDGFEITHGEVVLTVYGTCEGEYSWYYSPGRMTLANGDPGYPEEGELEQESFNCWVDTIEIDGEEQEDMTLSDAEMEKFEAYMSEKLTDVANEHEMEVPDEFEIDEEDW